MALIDIAKKMLGQMPEEQAEDMTPQVQVGIEKRGHDEKLFADLEAKFNGIKNNRIVNERQWYVNLAFYFGRQYVTWVTAGNFAHLYDPPAPSWRVRLVINKCRVIVRTELSKMVKERPRGFVVPSSGDDEDKNAAKIGDTIYEYLYSPSVLSLAYQLELALFWTSTCGVGFQKIYYDPYKMDFSGIMGSIVVKAVSPFHMRVPDLFEPDIEQQPYVIHEMARDSHELAEMYGVDVTPDSTSSVSTKDSKFANSLGVTQQATKNTTTVREFWIKPCRKYPEGLMAVTTSEQVLYQYKAWPYEHGMYPFVKFDHIPTGKFYTDSTLVDAIPIQKEFNRTVSQIVEAKNKTSKPVLLTPMGSIDPLKYTSEPGLIVQYRPGTEKPSVLEGADLPAYIINFLEFSQAQLNDVSSQHEISKGSTPAGVTAATAIAYLQEEDDSKLAFTIASIERGVEKTGKQLLALVKQFWDVPRQIKVVGEDMEYELQEYNNEDLRDSTDFRVEPGSATPRSKAARQAFLMEMSDRGLPFKELLKYLGMSETTQMYNDSQVDARAARKENSMVKSGEIQEKFDRNDWDDDLIHISEHDTFRKKQSYELMPPEQKNLLNVHVMMHKLHMAAKFGRNDLLPMQDPETQMMGDPSPMLDGFIEGIRSGAIPPIIPPPPPTPGELAMQAHDTNGGAVA